MTKIVLAVGIVGLALVQLARGRVPDGLWGVVIGYTVMGVAMRYNWLFERKPDVSWRQTATFILLGTALIIALDPFWALLWAAMGVQ
jgi:hypothetical protein